jgi:hypothetical protein
MNEEQIEKIKSKKLNPKKILNSNKNTPFILVI